MNKRTRQLISVQNKVIRLSCDLKVLQEKDVDVNLLSRRVEEIERLKDQLR